MKPEKNPLPWTIRFMEDIVTEGTVYDVHDANFQCVLGQDVGGDDAPNAVVAAFIVRACNAYDELVDALENIERSLNFSTNGGTSRNRFECELLKVAQTALRKARGEA